MHQAEAEWKCLRAYACHCYWMFLLGSAQVEAIQDGRPLTPVVLMTLRQIWVSCSFIRCLRWWADCLNSTWKWYLGRDCWGSFSPEKWCSGMNVNNLHWNKWIKESVSSQNFILIDVYDAYMNGNRPHLFSKFLPACYVRRDQYPFWYISQVFWVLQKKKFKRSLL